MTIIEIGPAHRRYLLDMRSWCTNHLRSNDHYRWMLHIETNKCYFRFVDQRDAIRFLLNWA